ncbi:MAG: hypothetical protein ABW044_06530 [Cellvibrio sp.]
MKLFYLVALILIVSGCSSHANKEDTSQKIGAAVTAPLTDLNLIKTKIPDALGVALKNPYAEPADSSCANLTLEINALDEALGPDLDTPVSKKDEGLIARSLVSESVSAIRKSTESVVPYRNWVRKLSGAERKSKTVAAAISAGGIRRAYLKGIGQANKCQAPAAPRALVTK